MIGRPIDRDGLAQRVSRPDEKRRFQFVIETAARTKNRRGGIGRLGLSMGTPHVRSAHDDGAGAAVIRDREPFPVWHECVFGTAQHRADIVRVVIGRIKIGVITNARRKLHRDVFLRVKDAVAQSPVIAQGRCVGGEQIVVSLPAPCSRRAGPE